MSVRFLGGSEAARAAVAAAVAEALAAWLADAADPAAEEAPTVFSSKVLPTISIRDYVARLLAYGQSPAGMELLAARVLMERSGAAVACRTSQHRLLLTAFMVACKVHQDTPLSNSAMALVGGVSPQELCRLEAELLRLTGYRTLVTMRDVRRAWKLPELMRRVDALVRPAPRRWWQRLARRAAGAAGGPA